MTTHRKTNSHWQLSNFSNTTNNFFNKPNPRTFLEMAQRKNFNNLINLSKEKSNMNSKI